MSTAKAITNTILTDGIIRRIIFKSLVSALLLLSVLYMYFIGSITFNILARESLENTSRNIGSRVGTLELSYLGLSNSIDQSRATTLGFVDINKPLFATQTIARVAIR